MKSVRVIIAGVMLVVCASCAPPPLLDVREIDGVPVLMQNDMPYFSRFNRTDHDVLDLSGTWKFQLDPEDRGMAKRWFASGLDESGWDEISVPGAWNTQRQEWLRYQGTGWYRLRFIAPREWEDRFNRLVIDGSNYDVRVWLNGEWLVGHRGGFSRWSANVSDRLNYRGDNLLVVRVNNQRHFDSLPPYTAPKAPLGWWPYGGLTRSVELESGPRTTLCKLAVDTDHLGNIEGSGVIFRPAPTAAVAEVKARLCDLDGRELKLLLQWPVTIGPSGIAVFRFKDRLAGARVWSPETPGNRYLVEVEVKDAAGHERQAVEVGFRSFEFKDGKAWLNGRPVFLRGVNRHEDDPETGPWQSDERIQKDLDLIKRLNANFVRGGHYPNDPRWLDACDRRGALMMTEIPLHEVPRSWKSLRAVEKRKLQRLAAQALIEMIERDRNHPSVVIWGLGNGGMTVFPSVKNMYAGLYRTAKRFDGRRPAVFAMLNLPLGLTTLLDRAGEVGDAVFINEYYGWYYGEPEDAGLLIERLHRRWPSQAIVVSETGAGAVPDLKPGGERRVWFGASRDYSEGYQAAYFRKQFEALSGKPALAGVCVFTFADFPDDKGRDRPIPDMNLKGLLTRDRKPKLAFGALARIFKEIERQEQQEQRAGSR